MTCRLSPLTHTDPCERPDLPRIGRGASGSDDKTVRLCDAGTWQGGLSTPHWVTALGWQPRPSRPARLVIDRLQRIGPGHYVSTQPVPVWGSWKTVLRVLDGKTMTAVPIWAPTDDAIPAPEIPAQASSTRPFMLEVTILQRERDPNVPGWLFTAGGVVVLIFVMVIAALTGCGPD
jgi:hypothetical protein